ncbi:MAG: hypothetical protein WDN49_15000 [Acetobacteraceae bacterium]
MRYLPALACLGLLAAAALPPAAQAQTTDTLRIGMRDDPDVLDPDLLPHLCRHRRDDRDLRQAVRLRRQAEHRPRPRQRL